MENNCRTVSICPCPNLECPNHGHCNNCSSRHLRIGTLNYCNFYAILPELEEAVKASPDTESAKIVKNRIDRQMSAYIKLMEKHNLSEDSRIKLRMEKAKESKH